MNEIKRTPGPWRVNEDHPEIVVARNDDVIANACYGDRVTGEANARLIAATPDFEEACRELVGARSGDGWVIGNVDFAANLAAAALAKVEGRAS